MEEDSVHSMSLTKLHPAEATTQEVVENIDSPPKLDLTKKEPFQIQQIHLIERMSPTFKKREISMNTNKHIQKQPPLAKKKKSQQDVFQELLANQKHEVPSSIQNKKAKEKQ